MRVQLARLRRMQFGHSFERLRAEIERLELALVDLEADARPTASVPNARDDAPTPAAGADKPAKGRPVRRPLPDHLPRETAEHATPAPCPACGDALRLLGNALRR